MMINYAATFEHVLLEAMLYVEGELELVLENGSWWARDYKEDLGGSFVIHRNEYDTRPLIKVKTAESWKIDVREICDRMGIAYVG